MTMFADRKARFSSLLAVCLLVMAMPASAQDSVSSGGEDQEAAAPQSTEKQPLSSPFASAKPGQTAPPGPDTPTGVELGLLHWYPIASRCTFVDPSNSVAGEATAELADDPDRKPYIFLTMTGAGRGATAALERGYVMANGLVRELEKGKTAPNRNGNVVTVWRSASEPRINVNTVIAEARKSDAGTQYSGTMTVFWGDKKEEVPIQGTCRN